MVVSGQLRLSRGGTRFVRAIDQRWWTISAEGLVGDHATQKFLTPHTDEQVVNQMREDGFLDWRRAASLPQDGAADTRAVVHAQG
jgi:hypothetical protein